MKYYVYFVQEKKRKSGKGGNMPVKIGSTNDPEKRLKALQTGNPRKLVIKASLLFDERKQAQEMEFTLHNLAGKKHKRLVGEWFMIYGSFKTLIGEAYKIFDGNARAKKEAPSS